MFEIYVKIIAPLWENNRTHTVKVFEKEKAVELAKEIYECVDVVGVSVVNAFTGEIIYEKEYGEEYFGD